MNSEAGKKYHLKFIPAALAEWQALDGSVKDNYVPGSRLKGTLSNCYKIKLQKQGYRLIYEIIEDDIVVLVLAVNNSAPAIP